MVAACLLAGPAWADTYVLVHGGWGGGWTFKSVERLLRAQNHEVYRPTLTGLGERVHLAHADTSLQTHITDVVNMIRFEALQDIILVGHSYGGMVMTGLADQIPDRIRRVVYVDALLPQNGESVLDIHKNAATNFAKLRKGDLVYHPAYRADGPYPQPVPQPVRTVTDKIALNGNGIRLPTLYILTVEPGKAAQNDPFYRHAQRARQYGWTVMEAKGSHNIQRDDPEALVGLLTRGPRVDPE